MLTKELLKVLTYNLLPQKALQYILRFHYLRKVSHFSESLERDLTFVKKLLGPGDCVVDIGGNIGIYTVFLSRLVGDNGSVHSFEPIPLTFEILSNNVSHLGLRNVRLHNIALSDSDRPGVMEIPRYRSGGENLYQARVVHNLRNTCSLRMVPVQFKLLDNIFSHPTKPISFIKIDVEGHEFQVINGSKQIIHDFKPALLIEMTENPDEVQSTACIICNWLSQEGYSCYWLDDLQLKRRCYGDNSVNYFFLTDDHLRQCGEEILSNKDTNERER